MKSILKLSLIALLFSLPVQAFAGHYHIPDTDSGAWSQYSFFDLRDRESFVQITNSDGVNARNLHVQIFNVDQDCNENDFFDLYTPNDTHVYNMRDIQTNDGNPSGVVLPDNAYGFVIIIAVGPDGDNLDEDADEVLVGNFRILDNSGYEYRTNSIGQNDENQPSPEWWAFNFSTQAGVVLSDVIFLNVDSLTNDPPEANPLDANSTFDIDIYDNAENPFSCRDVNFACIDQNSPLLEQLLEESEVNVAAFEYGINNAIPHSRGGELLCPGNTITEGWVVMDRENDNGNSVGGLVGLNNGNGRGSMDMILQPNSEHSISFD